MVSKSKLLLNPDQLKLQTYQRQCAYLSAMGIKIWQARRKLPYARPSLFAEIKNYSKKCSVDQKSHVDSSIKAQFLKENLSDFITSKSNLLAETVKTLPSIASIEYKTVPKKTPITFRFALLKQMKHWGILSYPTHPQKNHEINLLQAILRAINLPDDAIPVNLQWLNFQWPIMIDTQSDDPLAEAQAGLSTFLKAQQQRLETSYQALLVFGIPSNPDDCALIPVLNADEGISQTLNLPLILAPSLAELSGNIDAKRQLWHRIKQLRYVN